MEHVPWARELARRLLAEPLPRRWRHTEGVARQAVSVAAVVDGEQDLLICAAWLHDIGYAPPLAATGFHPLDGARYLRDVAGAGDRLCRLVAHHTCASIEAGNRGLAETLLAEFPPVDGFTLDVLTYCDMTTSPDGERVEVETRLSEILSRYGQGAIVSDSITQARPEIERAAQVVRAALAAQPR